MHIRFGSGDDERIEEVLKALDRGDTPDPHFERVYRDPERLHRITRPKNLELLQTIARDEPASIRELARLVDRDVRQVHDNVQELVELDLVELVEEGRSKRPTVWYDQVEIDLDLAASDEDTVKA